jgi:hypothetical protein
VRLTLLEPLQQHQTRRRGHHRALREAEVIVCERVRMGTADRHEPAQLVIDE